MILEDIALLSDLVLNHYFTKCIYCIGRSTCKILDNIMNKTMELVKEFFEDNLESIFDDLELILGEI